MSPQDRLTIISGGQTGADRAALDFALEHKIPHSGWCPRGRRAEDGALADRYELLETSSHRYPQRTKWNVRDSDATVAFTIAPELRGGTALTGKLARQLEKPFLHLSRESATGDLQQQTAYAAEQLRQFLRQHNVRRLNVAGPRASQAPEIARFVRDVLTAALLPPGKESGQVE